MSEVPLDGPLIPTWVCPTNQSSNLTLRRSTLNPPTLPTAQGRVLGLGCRVQGVGCGV